MEEWRTIEEFPDYSVSSEGRVMNERTGRILTPNRVQGFLVVPLRKNHRPYNHYVHRIVAATFINADVDGVQVKHVNGDKEDCSVRNLKITDFKTVMRQRSGRKVRIVETGVTYRSVTECARDINGAATGIYAVLNGRSWSYKGYHFRYVE